MAGERNRTNETEATVQSLRARVTDIPLREVMERLGYEGEHGQEVSIYRSEEGKVALMLYRDKVYSGDRQLLCRNSLELVMHMVNINDKGNITKDEAITWLADQFGEQSAIAVCLVEREQAVQDLFEERRQAREAQEKENIHTSAQAPHWEKEELDMSVEHTRERDSFIHER